MNNATNLAPIAFSKKGIESLLRQFKNYGYYEILEKNYEICEGKLVEYLKTDYFRQATQDYKGTVYFNQSSQDFSLATYFEIRLENNKSYPIIFVLEDFIYKVMDP